MKYFFLFFLFFSLNGTEIGYFKLTKNPIYLKKIPNQKLNSELELNGSSKKNEFLQVKEKITKNKKIYYKVEMKTRYMGMGKKENSFEAYIESSFGKFFTNQEFTKETLKELPDSFPKSLALQILEKDKNTVFDLSKSSIQKLNTKDFYLCFLTEGYYNKEGFGTYKSFSYLVKLEKENEYKVFEGRMNLFSDSVEDIDLDEDGIPEIHQQIRVRTAFETPNFYGYVNGKMTALSLRGNIDPKTKKIKNLKPSLNPENRKDEYTESIYKQGKFELIK